MLNPLPQELWPELPLKEWKDTYATLHMWTQIVGKVRLALTPKINHFWNSTLYLTARGLSTSPIPFRNQSFEIQFEFIDHTLSILTSWGEIRTMALAPKSVAHFYMELMNLLHSLGIHVKINTMPNEVPNPIPFEKDTEHAWYDREYSNRHWRILGQAERLMNEFRKDFFGKCSPVHFFWGSFDLAVTRFSGRRAPERPGADSITREAYSHEVSSCGFWPGSGNIDGPAFYSYAAPEPSGFSSAKVMPTGAFYNAPSKGYVLMYDQVRKSSDPDRMILSFFQSTYEAAAKLGNWDRAALERRTELRRLAA